MKHEQLDTEMTRKICEIVLHEREMSLSDREWKFRLRGYGYGIRDTDEGRIVTSLMKGKDLCTLAEPEPEEREPRYAA
ncbi:hypothetical protein [Marimonas arenosa]|uniref:Uncharacterized protein n=1 Tax=Marimonas arenosa TaxID=1795305 RepID=A0AAE3WE11_9RHOB|nr:hypothetical protein [Marimonas arenosa]MDQ2090987.1 hypothetical protein [Marimonas arenosa]